MSIKIGKKDILEFGTTRVGKLFVWTSYSALLFAVFYILDFSPHQAGLLSLSLGLLILFPQFKFEILSLGVLLYLYPPFVLFSQRSGIYQSFDQFHLNGTYWRMVFFFLTALSGALLCMGFRWLISTFSPRSPLRKYAFFIALVLFFAVVDLAPWQSLSQSTYAAFWMLVLGASLSLPMLGYDLEALDLKKPMTGFRRLTFYFPIWRLYFIVPPKGESYLRETEAKSDFELSAVRWSGLGLLFWATTILMFVIVCRQSLTEGLSGRPSFGYMPFQLHTPEVQSLLKLIAKGIHPSFGTAWLAVLTEFYIHFLYYVVLGHLTVSVIRIAGFKFFRNTYRPLESNSVNEFFGRYNYYFKEALLHLFYFPVYFNFFKKFPRLRVAFAVFASVGVGNYFLHLIKDIELHRSLGPVPALQFSYPYMVYCLVLSAVLTISTLMESRRRPPRSRHWALRSINLGWILVFYAVLRIFDNIHNGNIYANFSLFFELIGIRI